MNKKINTLNELKKAILFQENKIFELEKENTSLEDKLKYFNEKYDEILGGILKKVDNLNIDNDTTYEYYTEIEELENESEEKSLDEKKKNIKSTYRKAALLCHPDRVDSLQANKLFIRLNKYYKKNNLIEVNAIYEFLLDSNGYDFCTENITDINYLKYKYKENEEKIDSLTSSIEDIKSSETFNIIKNNDIEEYLNEIKDNMKSDIDKNDSKKFDNNINKDVKSFVEENLTESETLHMSISCFLGDAHIIKDELLLKNFLFRKGILHISDKKIVFHKKDLFSFGFKNEISIKDIVSITRKRALVRNIIVFKVPSDFLEIEIYSNSQTDEVLNLVNKLRE